MEAQFWRDRWRQGQTGFHQDRVNPCLQRFWGRLGLEPGQRVFVPLCGKSLDMLWLRDQGLEVFGIEVSPLAVKAFFTENGLQPHLSERGALQSWHAEGLELACGDFFDLGSGDLDGVAAVYDRAALIALPPGMRERYADRLLALLSATVPVLLVTLEYPQAQMDGPPFSVGGDEVQDLFGVSRRPLLLAREPILASEPGFRQKGLDELFECTWLLAPRVAAPGETAGRGD